ncbi:helix-turn-helix transcriptional regulator [Herbiconiux ginsengi]|uniref:Regulatory protein, luxR family n=1 Tax=Herbiconiux ginsengi TaxID=381665 RepID=A0A1H3LXK0_9MICO|nr:AAA family ATPase [Herbiconiux ginsengi]SDY68769.1 regulatory protein, luxR family [Herbiconiux ginsengi]
MDAQSAEYSDRLFGRDRERSLLTTFVTRALDEGGAHLLLGEAGVGKSRLLRLCAERATELQARVLRAWGVQYEADLGFSTLHQLLHPVLALNDRLPASSSAALRSALGMGSDGDEKTAPLAVYHAALALLERAARDEPVLLVVDDLHWVDASSAAALAFIARRLEGKRIALVGSVRLGEPSSFDGSDLESLLVSPLTPPDADELVRARNPGLSAQSRKRLVRLSAGYPLALVEWAGDERVLPIGTEEDTLPLPRRIEASFAARIGALSSTARTALLTLALDGRTELRALTDTGLTLDDLAPGEDAGAIVIDERAGVVDFRHPLFRSALVDSTSSAERRAIHKRIADRSAGDSDRRVWHLASAASQPDESIARLLHDLAHRSFARGDVHGAAMAITRSAALTPRDEDRAPRLAEAAFLRSEIAGEFRGVERLLADAPDGFGRGPGSLYAVVARAQVAVNGEGSYRVEIKLIEDAVRGGTHGWRADDEELMAAFRTWLLLCSYAGDTDLWESYFDALDRLTPEVPALRLTESLAVGDAIRRGGEAHEAIVALSETPIADSDPALAMSMIFTSLYLDLIELWRGPAWRLVETGRTGGPPRPYVRALAHLAINDFLHGRWGQAQELADEGARVCEQEGFANGDWYFSYLQSLLAAGRGDTETARAHADDVDASCEPRHSWGAQRFSYQPRTLAAVADGEWDTAYRLACRLSAPGEFPRFVPPAMWVAFDLVEAAVHTGRIDEARRHATAMVDAGLARVSDRMALLTAGAVALTDDQPAWRDSFERALETPDAQAWPFDVARIQLAYGERLRRAVDTSRAREVLHDSLERFERLGAVPWVRRAATELRAAGDARFRTAGAYLEMPDLTAQELVIAEMAASGMTNKEIGSRLFLSPRTVSGHLYNAFPKLGITSRAGLRDALASRIG